MALEVLSMGEMRLEVLLERERTRESVAEICRRHKISPASFYRYRARYLARGPDGLEPLSRRPLHSPAQISPDLEERLYRMRKEHPRWGARRIRAELIRSGEHPPACSTIHQALRRMGLVPQGRGRKPKATRRFERGVPNDLWQMDATRLKLTSGAWCWVIDILDDHARYLLGALACRQPTTELAWKVFEQAAGRFGLPRQVLTDNDLIFSGRLHGGVLVGFERRLKAAGVQLIHSRPYHPETNGKIERQHRTLKELVYELGPPKNIPHLQELLGKVASHYNTERPHQALGEATTPAERYLADEAGWSAPAEAEPAYPAGAVLRTVAAKRGGDLRQGQIQPGGSLGRLQGSRTRPGALLRRATGPVGPTRGGSHFLPPDRPSVPRKEVAELISSL